MSKSLVNSSNLQIVSQNATTLQIQRGVANPNQALEREWKEFTSTAAASPALLVVCVPILLKIFRTGGLIFLFLIGASIIWLGIKILVTPYFQLWTFDRTSSKLTYQAKNFFGVRTTSYPLNKMSGVAVQEMKKSGKIYSTLVLLRQTNKTLLLDSSHKDWSDHDKAFATDRQHEVSACIRSFMSWQA